MNESSSLGYGYPLWNFTALDVLVAGKCNNTYQAVSEYMLAGGYELWITMDIPW